MWTSVRLDQFVGAVEYTECISAEGLYPLTCVLEMTQKQSDGVAFGNLEYPFMAITPRSTDSVLCLVQIELFDN